MAGLAESSRNDGRNIVAIELSPLHSLSPAPTVTPIATEQDRLASLNVASVDDEANVESVAEVDGGFGAWSYLASAFFVEMIVWGFPTAFGTFLEAYLREEDIIKQPHATSLLPLIGTLSSGIIYCTGPLTFPLASRFRQYRRPAMWLGTIISWASLFTASFTRKITSLLLLQGVMYAVGCAILYPPVISYVSEWFVDRRGLALGVIDAGNAAGGLILPLILPNLIRVHGTSLTLRYLSFGFIAGMVMTLPFIRPRLSERGAIIRPSQRLSSEVWIRSPHWWLILVVNTLQGFAWFMPMIWLPTYTSELGVSSSQASLSLALLNGASMFSRLSLGTLSDHFSPWLLAFTVLSTTSIATFLFWGVAGHIFAGVLVFGITFGGITGGWSSLWSGFLKPVTGEDVSLYVSLLGHLTLTRGLANVLSTPISNALSSRDSASLSIAKRMTGFDVAEGRYKSMIIFVGSCFAASAAISLFAWRREKTGR